MRQQHAYVFTAGEFDSHCPLLTIIMYLLYLLYARGPRLITAACSQFPYVLVFWLGSVRITAVARLMMCCLCVCVFVCTVLMYHGQTETIPKVYTYIYVVCKWMGIGCAVRETVCASYILSHPQRATDQSRTRCDCATSKCTIIYCAVDQG